MALPYLREVQGGVELSLKVQPRASRSRVVGALGDALKVQLAAPPVEGAANDAPVLLFAELLGVPRRQVTLVAGSTSRTKRLRIDGVDAGQVEAAMNAGA